METLHDDPNRGFSSSVIERLREREVLLQNGDLVAYYYFTFNDFEKRKIVCMLENLVAQVALHGLQTHQRSVTDILVQLYQKYRNSLHRPSNSELSDALMDMVGVSEKGYVFIVVDALDECSDNNILLKVLRSIHAQQKTRLRVLVSSRPEAGILETLNSLKFFSVPLETSVVDADIERYVDMRLTRSSRWEFLGQDLKDSIRKKLVTGSKGM
jgi:hypothetical protein